MKFKIVSYDFTGEEHFDGMGELDAGQLSFATDNPGLQDILEEIVKNGEVPAKTYIPLNGEAGEHLDGNKLVPITDPNFLSYLSDYLVYWSFIEIEEVK